LKKEKIEKYSLPSFIENLFNAFKYVLKQII
jgi:hypothetical protein